MRIRTVTHRRSRERLISVIRREGANKKKAAKASQKQIREVRKNKQKAVGRHRACARAFHFTRCHFRRDIRRSPAGGATVRGETAQGKKMPLTAGKEAKKNDGRKLDAAVARKNREDTL